MTRFITGFLLAVVLLLGYWAWPFVGLRDIAADLQARDSAALSRDVDFVSLRRSLTEQVIAAYFRVAGPTAKLGDFATAVVSAIGGSAVDALIEQITNPENLIQLLNGGKVSTELGEVSINVGELPGASLDSARRAWLGTEYRLDHFSIGVPVGAVPSEQFRLRLQLVQWHWKLTGIDLPWTLRDQLAQDLAKKFP
jgi:hypothetical protein